MKMLGSDGSDSPDSALLAVAARNAATREIIKYGIEETFRNITGNLGISGGLLSRHCTG